MIQANFQHRINLRTKRCYLIKCLQAGNLSTQYKRMYIVSSWKQKKRYSNNLFIHTICATTQIRVTINLRLNVIYLKLEILGARLIWGRRLFKKTMFWQKNLVFLFLKLTKLNSLGQTVIVLVTFFVLIKQL